MTATLCIAGTTIALMIAAIIFFPRLTLGRFSVDTYWPIGQGHAAFLFIITAFLREVKTHGHRQKRLHAAAVAGA